MNRELLRQALDDEFGVTSKALRVEIEALRASRDELRKFHDAAMVEAGRLLGMENPEEEPRFKWVALGISEVVRDRAALRERVKVLREVVESAAAADVFKDSPGAMDRLAEYARAALEAQ